MAMDHLAGERATAQFDVQAMKVYLAGGQREHEIATRMAQLVANDPVRFLRVPSRG
jgi:acyl-CoA oxidase